MNKQNRLLSRYPAKWDNPLTRCDNYGSSSLMVAGFLGTYHDWCAYLLDTTNDTIPDTVCTNLLTLYGPVTQ